MGKNKFKRYGHLKINKLDWLLAISCCLFAIAALWISLGISIVNKGPGAVEAFMTFARGLAFNFSIENGQSAVVSMFVCILVYGAALLLCLGCIFLVKVKAKERIAGVVAAFVAAVGIALFTCFSFEYMGGKTVGDLSVFWPVSLIIFIILFVCFMVFDLYATFNRNLSISLDGDKEGEGEEEDKEEAEPVYEEVVDEEEVTEEVVEEEVEEQPEEQPVEEVAEEELEEIDEDEEEEYVEEETEEEVEGGKFDGLGPRKKRIPFENKVKRAKPEVRARYKLIVNALREYDFNDRKSIPCETFSYKKEKLIILAFSGQTLKAYFRLNPNDYDDSPIPVKDVSDVKKYEDTPCCLVVKSDLAARRVVLLAERIINERNIPAK